MFFTDFYTFHRKQKCIIHMKIIWQKKKQKSISHIHLIQNIPTFPCVDRQLPYGD